MPLYIYILYILYILYIYCTKWRSGQVSRMLYGLTDSQTLKDSATQFLTEYKGGALVTQLWQEKKKRGDE